MENKERMKALYRKVAGTGMTLMTDERLDKTSSADLPEPVTNAAPKTQSKQEALRPTTPSESPC